MREEVLNVVFRRCYEAKDSAIARPVDGHFEVTKTYYVRVFYIAHVARISLLPGVISI